MNSVIIRKETQEENEKIIVEKEVELKDNGKKLVLPTVPNMDVIIGLDKCEDLEELRFGMGRISEIKGLDTLVNLKKLYLNN